MRPVWHKLRRRSWWDGHVVAYCGYRANSDEIREGWLDGGVTCKDCKREYARERSR